MSCLVERRGKGHLGRLVGGLVAVAALADGLGVVPGTEAQATPFAPRAGDLRAGAAEVGDHDAGPAAGGAGHVGGGLIAGHGRGESTLLGVRGLVRLLVAVLLLGAAPSATAHPLAGAPRCPVFPADNPWNRRVDHLPVASDSARIVAAIGADEPLHPDFGTRYGIPFTTVSGRAPRVPVTFTYAAESDRVSYPISRTVPLEAGGDRHAIVVDRDRCRLYELFAVQPPAPGTGGGGWRAGSGATWSLRSNRLRPRGWTSADAAGLAILPGLARWDDVRRGSIDHALRFTVSRTRRAFVWPARHFASSLTDPALPPMGLRLRLRASLDVSRFPRQARIVLVALQRYGMLVADNGSDWYVTGAPSPHWDDEDLHTLSRVRGADFEVVRG